MIWGYTHCSQKRLAGRPLFQVEGISAVAPHAGRPPQAAGRRKPHVRMMVLFLAVVAATSGPSGGHLPGLAARAPRPPSAAAWAPAAGCRAVAVTGRLSEGCAVSLSAPALLAAGVGAVADAKSGATAPSFACCRGSPAPLKTAALATQGVLRGVASTRKP